MSVPSVEPVVWLVKTILPVGLRAVLVVCTLTMMVELLDEVTVAKLATAVIAVDALVTVKLVGVEELEPNVASPPYVA